MPRRVRALLMLSALMGIGACGESTGGATELRIAVATTGVDLDDGYVLFVDGDSVATLSPQGEFTLPTSAGTHEVSLQGTRENCTVSAPTQSVSVSSGSRRSLAFSVTCRAYVGGAVIRTITSGVDKDPDGYLVSIGGATPRYIDYSQDLTIDELPAGEVSLALTGIADNCALTSANPITLSVPFEQTGFAQFALTCERNVGSLNVVIAGSGDAIPSNFSVQIYPSLPRPIGSAGEVIADVPAGDRSVTLDVGPDCVVAGSATHLVPVRYAQTAATTFSVTCWRRLAFSTSRDGNFEIYTVRSDGSSPSRFTYAAGSDVEPDWSPAGTQLVYANNLSGVYELFVMNADRTGMRQLTNTGHNNYDPAWSPNGERIVFTSDRDGTEDIYTIKADGSGLRRLTSNGMMGHSPRFSPDGSRIVFVGVAPLGNPDVFTIDTLGGALQQVTDDAALELDPAYSNDGTRILYTSSIAPGFDIYSIGVNGTGRVRLTTDGYYNRGPRMSPSGATIVYVSERDGNQNLYLMNSDGSMQHAITSHAAADNAPAWKP